MGAPGRSTTTRGRSSWSPSTNAVLKRWRGGSLLSGSRPHLQPAHSPVTSPRSRMRDALARSSATEVLRRNTHGRSFRRRLSDKGYRFSIGGSSEKVLAKETQAFGALCLQPKQPPSLSPAATPHPIPKIPTACALLPTQRRYNHELQAANWGNQHRPGERRPPRIGASTMPSQAGSRRDTPSTSSTGSRGDPSRPVDMWTSPSDRRSSGMDKPVTIARKLPALRQSVPRYSPAYPHHAPLAHRSTGPTTGLFLFPFSDPMRQDGSRDGRSEQHADAFVERNRTAFGVPRRCGRMLRGR